MSSVERSKSWAELGPSPSAWLYSKADNAGGGGRRLLAGGAFLVAGAAEFPVRGVVGTVGGIKNAVEKVWAAEKRAEGRRGPSSTLFNKTRNAEGRGSVTKVAAGITGGIVVLAELPIRVVTETLGAWGRAGARVVRR